MAKGRVESMRIVALLLTVAISLPVFAADENEVVYEGGTIPNLHSETTGHFDTTNRESLTFVSSTGQTNIPYAQIDSYEYSQHVVHHLGVLPIIAAGLVRARKKNHFVRIVYHDDNSGSQVAVFRVPKHLPNTLMPVLQTRAPITASPCNVTGVAKCWEK
jgi:hypothetical protein